MQDCAERLLRKDCPAYNDGKQALYILKLMLVKMAHKDWTPIDRQWITSQARRLRANMAAVCHFGCEGSVSDGQLRATGSLAVASTATAEEMQQARTEIRCEVKILPAWMPLIQKAQEQLEASGEGILQTEVVEVAAQASGEGENISNRFLCRDSNHICPAQAPEDCSVPICFSTIQPKVACRSFSVA
jgi:hypothetical protein